MMLAPAIQAASFTPLGDLPGGEFRSVASGVSNDGMVVVGYSTNDQGVEAFRYTPDTGMVGLGDLPGGFTASRANAVSADGSVVVGYANSALGQEAFRWTSGTGMVALGDLPGGEFRSEAFDVSADGSIVVGRGAPDGDDRAFRWTSETGMVDLGVIPDSVTTNFIQLTEALAVSADGSVVVGLELREYLESSASLTSEIEAFRWTSETGMLGLGFFPGGNEWSTAVDVSADGRVVVGFADLFNGPVGAFRWTSEIGMVSLGSLGDSIEDRAFATSGDGNVVVGTSYGRFGNPDVAFIWTQSAGMRNLQDVLVARGATGLEGWTLDTANAVSDNGRWIAGWGFNPSGDREAFLADTLIQFNDVPPDHWAIDFVHKFADSQISRGCSDGNFCPDNLVTRAQMAVYLERGMRGHDYTPRPARGNVFADVAAGDFGAAFVEQLSADGITGGCGSNNYCPDDAVTRAQMAVFLLKAKHGATYTPPPPSGTEFGDVDSSHWAVAWIEQLAAEGITGGCGDGNFCPNGPVTRAHMAVFMVRTFGL